MQTHNARKFLAAVFGILFVLAVAFLLHRHSQFWSQGWDMLRPQGRKEWGEVVELVGAFLTALGLLGTFTRGWMSDVKADLFGLGKFLALLVGVKGLRRITRAPRLGDVEFTLVQDRRVEQHVEGLAVFVNDLAKRLPRIEDDIVQVAEAVLDTRSRIDNLARELVSEQRADLKWAAVGLLITAAGIALGYKAGAGG